MEVLNLFNTNTIKISMPTEHTQKNKQLKEIEYPMNKIQLLKEMLF